MQNMVAVKLSHIAGYPELLFYVVGQKPAVERNLSNLINAYNEKYAEVSFSSGTKVVVESLNNSTPLVDIADKPLQEPELVITDTGFLQITASADKKRKALATLEEILNEGILRKDVEEMIEYFIKYPSHKPKSE